MDPLELIEVAKSLQLYVYLKFVCGTLLVYDYMVTFSDETDLMWKGKWNLLNATFYAVRYLPFFDIGLGYVEQFLSPADPVVCKTIYSIFSISILVGVDLANCILTLRTYAIWGKDKRILLTLGLVLLASVVGEGYFMTSFLVTMSFINSPDPSVFRGCFIAQANTKDAWAAYLILLVLESVIFVLTLIKYIQQSETRNQFIIQTIYRDGLLFYIFIFGISLINIILLQTEQLSSAYGVLLIGIHRVLHAILSCRLVLNIRKAAAQRALAYTPPTFVLSRGALTSTESGQQGTASHIRT